MSSLKTEEKTMKRVLIVEDEDGLLDGLAHNFRYEGYEVLTAKNGQEGLKLALKQKPDVVLLDIMLPEKDGFTVLKELRQRHRDIPVLVMTARNFEADVLKGFDLGADDYVTKPFGIKELMARVKRLVQRGPSGAPSPGPTIYKFGDVEVRFEPRETYKAGKQVALSFKEFELLKYLIEHRGRTVSREELLEEIWGVDEDLGVTTRTVDTHVSNLRSKLGAGFPQPFIVAVHKVGYKFVQP
jgi:two-component system, OmpR family, alkaline phosphatase synthesis response regulator PhoP